MSVHQSVLLNEVLEYLNVEPGRRYIDATLNGGGHAAAIAERGGIVLGIEWDPALAGQTAERFASSPLSDHITVVNDSYVNMVRIAGMRNFRPDGILFDLGLSSWHYEASGRGFSFKRDEPLDMRFDAGAGMPASEIVNTYEVAEIEQILRDYGEEQFSHQIADAIGAARKRQPIMTSGQLAAAVESAVPNWYKHRKIHCATKTFQALRVVVNDELKNVERGVRAALEILSPSGRLVVISFQGHEDKIVREIFKEEVKKGTIILPAKRTIRPEWAEQKENPRSRSAKMKIAEKI
ncbi:MAG TPA: 16S rRNA (cytosine(1402)-N(4))-methyltransferase RsmH [Candidatus Paceibacterota bacterium]|nr:16S rRNA (cytosine(1402)-N(4))-methyltransferase RsmH [Candidatus Paceibacterota bacterium]